MLMAECTFLTYIKAGMICTYLSGLKMSLFTIEAFPEGLMLEELIK